MMMVVRYNDGDYCSDLNVTMNCFFMDSSSHGNGRTYEQNVEPRLLMCSFRIASNESTEVLRVGKGCEYVSISARENKHHTVYKWDDPLPVYANIPRCDALYKNQFPIDRFVVFMLSIDCASFTASSVFQAKPPTNPGRSERSLGHHYRLLYHPGRPISRHRTKRQLPPMPQPRLLRRRPETEGVSSLSYLRYTLPHFVQ